MTYLTIALPEAVKNYIDQHQPLLNPKKKPFLEALSQIPDVGTDADFARVQDLSTTNSLD